MASMDTTGQRGSCQPTSQVEGGVRNARVGQELQGTRASDLLAGRHQVYMVVAVAGGGR